MRQRTIALLAAFASIGSLAAPAPARAIPLGGVVYDPSNHAENILTAARALASLENQAKQIANEAQMIAYHALDLESLPYSAKSELLAKLAEIDALLKSAKSLAYEVAEADAEFKALFPEDYGGLSNTAMIEDARAHWREASRAAHDSILMQAKIAHALAADTMTLGVLVDASQDAVGALQAAQANNQLIALQAKQSMQTAQLLIVHSRAADIERAKNLQAQERARVHRSRFLGDGAAYTKE